MSQSRPVAPMVSLILLNMATSWRGAAPGVLDDFAAVVTFLLNCEGTYSMARCPSNRQSSAHGPI